MLFGACMYVPFTSWHMCLCVHILPCVNKINMCMCVCVCLVLACTMTSLWGNGNPWIVTWLDLPLLSLSIYLSPAYIFHQSTYSLPVDSSALSLFLSLSLFTFLSIYLFSFPTSFLPYHPTFWFVFPPFPAWQRHEKVEYLDKSDVEQFYDKLSSNPVLKYLRISRFLLHYLYYNMSREDLIWKYKN